MERIEIISKHKDYPNVLSLKGDYCNLLREEIRNGIKIYSPKEEMELRIKSSENSNIGLHDGLWTSATFIYGMKRKPLLTLSFSQAIKKYLNNGDCEYDFSNNTFRALLKNCSKGYFTIESLNTYKMFYKKAKNECNKPYSERSTIILQSLESLFITNDFNFEILEFLARNKRLAENYFDFNGNKPIQVGIMEKKLANSSNETILNQLWFSSLESGSKLSGNRNLGHSGYLRCRRK